MSDIRKEIEALSREELIEGLTVAYNKLEEMSTIVNSMQTNALYKRVEFLFKVVEFAHIFPVEFVNKITKEIESLLTMKEDKNNKTDE